MTPCSLVGANILEKPAASIVSVEAYSGDEGSRFLRNGFVFWGGDSKSKIIFKL
jgi:hypothetical protein